MTGGKSQPGTAKDKTSRVQLFGWRLGVSDPWPGTLEEWGWVAGGAGQAMDITLVLTHPSWRVGPLQLRVYIHNIYIYIHIYIYIYIHIYIYVYLWLLVLCIYIYTHAHSHLYPEVHLQVWAAWAWDEKKLPTLGFKRPIRGDRELQRWELDGGNYPKISQQIAKEISWFISYYLVGGLEHFYFPIFWVANHPNWLSYFFRGVAQPPTSYRNFVYMYESESTVVRYFHTFILCCQ